MIWGCSAAGSAHDWQSCGRGFEPRHLHQLIKAVFPFGKRPFWFIFPFVLSFSGNLAKVMNLITHEKNFLDSLS